MNTLSIEGSKRKNSLTAKLNGQALPMISHIEIISNIGELTKVQITLIVARVKDEEVIIREYTNDTRPDAERGHSTNDNVKEIRI